LIVLVLHRVLVTAPGSGGVLDLNLLYKRRNCETESPTKGPEEEKGPLSSTIISLDPGHAHFLQLMEFKNLKDDSIIYHEKEKGYY
jgi:hypothetical protein